MFNPPYPQGILFTLSFFLIGIQGLGGGAYLLLAPVYSMETSQISIRGAFGGAMSVMLALGGLFDNGLGAVIHWFPLTCIISTLPSKQRFLLLALL